MENSPKEATLQKFREIVDRWNAANEAITLHTNIKSDLERQAQDCHAAARVFGFDIMIELAQTQPVNIPQENVPALAAPIKDRTVAERILEEAEKAYPSGVRAKALTELLSQERGEKLHEKTTGMTLYRLSKEGKMIRKGHTWFFNKSEETVT